MKPFSFIHAADLHIDSPFKGVSTESEQLATALQKSTYLAFENLIDTCIELEVDFLLVAGDVYDGRDRSLGAQLKFHKGLTRLAAAGIRSFVVHGNHDPLDGRVSHLDWPAEVTIFGKAAETVDVRVDDTPVAAISGVSFPKQDVRSNLARKLKPTSSELFQIGLLHCNVGANTGHEPYAPCELSELKASGIDYWALGHVHTRQTLAKKPHVIYPGNPQGRSVREQGARGCYHVKVDGDRNVDLEFISLDVIRWEQASTSIDGLESMTALEKELVTSVESMIAASEGRGVICRLRVEGRGPLYGDLHADGARDELLAHVRERFAGDDPIVWVQRIDTDCRPVVDLDKRASRGDLLAEILTVAREYRDDPDLLVAELRSKVTDQLWQNSRAKSSLDPIDDELLNDILGEAELLCLDLLEDDR